TIIFLTLNISLWAEMYEVEKIGLGDVSINTALLTSIPLSPYILVSSSGTPGKDIGGDLMTFDIIKARVRDGFINEIGELAFPVVVPSKTEGWDLFFTSKRQIGSIHINNDGEFGNTKFMSIPFQQELITSFGVPNRSEVWYAADKIYRYTEYDDKWAEYEYPEGWDIEQSAIKVFPTGDPENLFIILKNSLKLNAQAARLNMITGEMKTFSIDNLQIEDPNQIYCIDNWNKSTGQYLILKGTYKGSTVGKTLYSYDSNSDEITMLIDGFEVSSFKIIQDDNGRYVYLLGKTGSNIYILDTKEKSFENHVLSLEQYWSISIYSSGSMVFYDKVNKRIITEIQVKDWGVKKPLIIDLDTLTCQYIDGILPRDRDSSSLMFLYYYQEENILLISGGKLPYIEAVNLETGEIKTSIPISYKANNWSVSRGDEYPKYIGNTIGFEFCNNKSIGRKDFFKTEISSDSIAYYPESNTLFIKGNSIINTSQAIFGEYSFLDNSFVEIELPYKTSELYPDPSRNQVVGIYHDNIDKNDIVEFIKPRGDVTVWIRPEKDRAQASIIRHLDTDMGLIFIVCEGWWLDNNWLLYEISLDTCELVKKYKVSNDIVHLPLQLSIDPLKRFFYLIDLKQISETLDYAWDLLIFDFESGNLLHTFPLRDKLINSYSGIKPFVIPIPERNKLFVMDHFGSWCLDTDKMAMDYTAFPADNQSAVGGSGIYGNWNGGTKKLTILDLIFDDTTPQRVLQIDLDTGNVINQTFLHETIDQFFIPKNTDVLYFLNAEKSSMFTLHPDPKWQTPALINTSTNFVHFGEGDHAKFRVNLKNTYNFEQNVTAFIWLFASDSTMLFFSPTGWSSNAVGIPLPLPANLDMTADILSFTMPARVPAGFYNFNAVFINENGDRGPISTWNFYVKD
ncbi:hypothetical protein KKB18_02740, partial [bacterium]|nr:hypothetical protein [bacterium]